MTTANSNSQTIFNRLWIGQTFSVAGSYFGAYIMPAIAVLALHAQPFQVGLLEALALAPFVLLALPIGVSIDHLPLRPVMIGADAFRALILFSACAFVIVGHFGVFVLYGLAVLLGSASVFFDLAWMSAIPRIVSPERLIHANARLETTNSGAEIAAAGVSTLLTSWLGPAGALASNAALYVTSSLAVAALPPVPQTPPESHERVSFWSGMTLISRSPILRAILSSTSAANLGMGIYGAVYMIYLLNTLHLPIAWVSIILGVSNVGFIGGLIAPRLASRWSMPAVLAISVVTVAVGLGALYIASFGRFPAGCAIVGQILVTCASSIYNVTQVSWRQSITESHHQGRVNGAMRGTAWLAALIGMLVGGLLAQFLSVPLAIGSAAALVLLACLPVTIVFRAAHQLNKS